MVFSVTQCMLRKTENEAEMLWDYSYPKVGRITQQGINYPNFGSQKLCHLVTFYAISDAIFKLY